MEPKGAQGTHKGPKKASIWESVFAKFANFRDSGARWAWKVATASQNVSKMLQKETPAASNTSKIRLEICMPKRCSRGSILSPRCLPRAPEGAHLEHPGAPNPQNIAFYHRKTLIFTKSTNLNFEPLWAQFLSRGLTYGAQGCPRNPKGIQTGSNFGVIFHKICQFSRLRRQMGLQGGHKLPPSPKMIKNAPKSDPGCFKNIKIPASTSTKKATQKSVDHTLQPSPPQFVKCWRGRRQRR